jgi:hypothetical protein
MDFFSKLKDSYFGRQGALANPLVEVIPVQRDIVGS